MKPAPTRRRKWPRAALLLALLAGDGAAGADTGWDRATVENWGYFQKNENGSDQWKYQPRLLIPYRFADGATFTQRVDVPLITTDAAGAGNPGGGWSGGVGDVFVEEAFESKEVAPSLTLKASVRFVFPTGRQSPFGSSQYQWAPGAGLVYAMPGVLHGVTLAPYVRYFSGFDPQYADVKETRKLDLYPAVSFALPRRWTLQLYPDNPITYDERKKTWFVPLDLMLAHRIGNDVEYGLGGAWKLGHPSDPSYRYLIDARLTWRF